MMGPLAMAFSSSTALETLVDVDVDDDGLTLMGVKASADEKTTDATAMATENFIVYLFFGLITFDFSVY